VFAQIEDYVHRGCSMPEAIEAVAFPDEHQLLEAAE
jgi:conjugal transfer ATP-binding protein TraC